MSAEDPPAQLQGTPVPAPGRACRPSLLSPAELAATLGAGAEPLGVVQGTVVMWSPSDRQVPLFPNLVAEAGYQVERWPIKGLRDGWFIEDPVAESAWNGGFDEALARLVADAAALGAHGVVGITHRRRRLGSSHVIEHTLLGTAVLVPDAPPPPFVWSTHLVGPTLSSLVRSGWMPVSWVTAMGALQHRNSSYAAALRSSRARSAAPHLVGEFGAAAAKAMSLALARLDGALGGDRLVRGWDRWWSRRARTAGSALTDFHAYAIVGTRLRRFGGQEPPALDTIVPTVDLR